MENLGLRNDKTYHVYRELCTFSTKLSTMPERMKTKAEKKSSTPENGGDGDGGDEKRRKTKS